MVEDVGIGVEDAVGQPVLPHELPDVLHRIQLRAFRRELHQGDVRRHRQVARGVPACLIQQQHGMGIVGDAARRRHPSGWSKARTRQIDRDGRWTLKRGKKPPPPEGAQRQGAEIAVPVFGYKNHINIDRTHG
jgi:hypothetical protein